MSLLEWVRVAEDAREQQDDERVATGLESLRMAVGELVPLDRVALIAVDSPERARNEIRAACRRLSTRDPWKALAPAVFRDLVEGLISTVFGLGPLEDLIADETVTEIMVNGTDSVYIERDGRLSRASVSFESDEQVRALIDRILGPLGRRVDESSPMASARLPQGHRVNVVLPPLSLNGPLLTIRAFTRRVMTLAELKARGSFDETVEQFLIWAVGSRRSIAVSGGTGSGKTTLIKLANGLLTPTSGEILIAGKAPCRATKAIVSYLPDRNTLPGWMTIAQALDYYGDFYSDFRRGVAEAMLMNLGLDRTQKIKTLSKGMREKTQLILTMSRDAKLYLLDEPIGGVDPATRDYILRTIIGNYSEDAAVIISTHLIADVEQILDEVVFLREGQVMLHESVETIRDEKGKSVDELFREVFRC